MLPAASHAFSVHRDLSA